MKHLQRIFEQLNLTKEKGLYFLQENLWKGLFTNRIERLLEEVIKPDAFFCIDNKPFVLFFENPKNKDQKLWKIWNFNESPIIIISTEDSLEIYNGFEFLEEKETLNLLGNGEILNEFTYFKLVTGETWEKYESKFQAKNRVDYKLLKNIEAAQKRIQTFNVERHFANALLGKIIFVRYLIDRGVKLDFDRTGSRKWSNQDLCALLLDRKKVISFFTYLKDKFNGNLFQITNKELESIPQESFTTLIDLLSGNEISSGQISLFDFYDFSIIPVEFISNVYELFIGKDQQESNGAYYTPLFLVDYILSQTVQKKFSDQKSDYSCRVLDPSCGSGIFLVETLRKIIEQFRANNPKINSNTSKYKNALKELATQNIFGVDKDRSAVDVAIFSIYLTLLDYQTPSDIETFKFPVLFGKNFFSYDFFDEQAEFNPLFKDLEFDFILGNPPWKEYGIGEVGKEYLKNRKSKERSKQYQVGINNGEIVEGFIFRAGDFAGSTTQIAFVIKSTILYNKGYSDQSVFRRYLLQEFLIDKVLELAPVRFEVFDKSNDSSIAPAAVIFYRPDFGNKCIDNIIEHITIRPSRFFSLFKVFTINRSDYKKIGQNQLMQYDWLWKTLIYGTYLDFNFIKRLKKEFNSLAEILSDKNNFKKGTGLTLSPNGKEDSTHLIGLPFLETTRVQPFHINLQNVKKFNHERVGRRRDSDLFNGSVLLVRNGLDTQELKPRAAIYEGNGIVFKKALTGIKPLSDQSLDLLKKIIANLYSNLYPYIAINTFSSIGIEREQTKEYEKFDIPFIENEFEKLVDVITEASKKINLEKHKTFSDAIKISRLQSQIERRLDEINNQVYAGLSIEKDGLEASLIDYALTVIRPTIIRGRTEIPAKLFSQVQFKDDHLSNYVNVFVSRFNEIFQKLNQQIVAEIKHTNQIIGLFFKVVDSGDREPITWIKADNDELIRTLSLLGTEKITDRLFIQKDVRGFEKNGFYMIKPNEKRLWHKAIAYLDLNEFMDAVLVAGKKSVVNVQ